jgi:hypothetical protein
MSVAQRWLGAAAMDLRCWTRGRRPVRRCLARPAVQAHDAVDLLAVDHHALAFGEAGMGHAHAVGGMRFDHRTDGLDAHRIALRLDVASTRLVISGGARHAEQTAQHADRHRRGSRLEELILHGYHEIPSGKSLP